MKLSDRPYPGEPIYLAGLTSQFLLSDGRFAIRTSSGNVVVGGDIVIGYDALCPDWRERLGKAMGRIEEMVETPVGDEMDSAVARAHSECLAIIREEFGIKEETP